MAWKMSLYMSQTLGYVTTCPEHQHLSPHMAHTFGCATTCVLQLKGVTVSPHSLQARMALGSQGWGLGVLEKGGPVGHHCLVTLHVQESTAKHCPNPGASCPPSPPSGRCLQAQGQQRDSKGGHADTRKALWCSKTGTLSQCLSFLWV